MKRAKHNHFIAQYHDRLSLWYDNQSQDNAVPTERQCRQWVWHALKNHYRHANLSVLFCEREQAYQYNHDYRGKDDATNILSFALNEGECMLPGMATDALQGDLILCPDIVQAEALAQNKPLQAHYAHLIVHGTLHLMGYDHIEPEDAVAMESLEIQLLNQLGYPNPY